MFLVLLGQKIEDAVFKAAEAEGYAVLVALSSVVEDNVQDYLYAVLVKLFYKRLEFVYASSWTFVCRIGSLGGKKAHCAVAPVVLHSLACPGVDVCVFVFVKFKDWKQLYARNSQPLKVGNLLCKACVCSGARDSVFLSCGKALKVGFVDDAFGKGIVKWLVSLPVKGGIVHNHALGEFFHVPALKNLHVFFVHRRPVSWRNVQKQ